MRREALALIVLIIVIVISAVAYFAVDVGFETTPVQRSEQQNSGVTAPLNQQPSPGTVKDERGDPELPEQQQ
jgi:hypothetical protein